MFSGRYTILAESRLVLSDIQQSDGSPACTTGASLDIQKVRGANGLNFLMQDGAPPAFVVFSRVVKP